MSSTRARAIFVATIMVISVVGMTAAFAGSAAAEQQTTPTDEVIVDDEDGQNVDYTSIQDALNNTGDGTLITVREGIYNESLTISSSNVSIKGAGIGQSVIQGAEVQLGDSDFRSTAVVVGSTYTENPVSVENISISGFTIHQNTADNGVIETTGGATQSSITIEDNRFVANGTTSGYGLYLPNAQNARIASNEFAVEGSGAIEHLATDSDSAKFVIEDNNFKGDITRNGNGNAVEVRGTDFNIGSNDFSAVSTDGAIVADISDDLDLATVLSQNTFDQTVTVEDSSGTLSSGIYGSIQPAVDAASPGSTVTVGSGTYEESVSIDTADVTLEGPNAGVQGTDTATRGAEAVINSTSKSPAVVVNGSQVILDGFEIRSDGQDGIRLDNSTIDDIAIINNRITDVDGSAYIRDNNPSGAGNGIQIQFTEDGSVDNTVDNVSISRNLISGVSTADTKGRTLAIGINVLPRGNNITRLNITENTITGLKPGDSESEEEARGISIDTHVTVSNDNKFEGGTDDSKGVVNAPVIAGNDIRDFSANASGPFEAAGITFFGDNADNTDIGVNDFQITSNTIKNITNQRAGVPSSTVLIGGEYSDLGDDHQVTDNTLVEGAVIRYSTSTPDTDDALNATSNWWGSQNGPSAGSENTYNDGNQGAGVSDNVEFTPWLNASTDNNGQPFAPVTNSSGGQFATIQDAVETADSGDTVEVKPGTYEESVTIETEKITLKGVGEPTIVGAGTSEGSQPHAAIHVNDGSGPVQDVTISGFTVRNPSGNFGIFAGTGSTNKAPDGIGGLVIQNTTVENVSTQVTGSALTGGPAGIGIRADYGTDGNPGIEIKKNEISDVQNSNGPEPVGITLKSFTGDAGFGFDSNGDPVTDASSPPATDTDIVNNTISNISSDGGYATKGISISGEFEDVDVINNDITGIESPGGTALGITLSENGDSYSGNKYDIDDDGSGERIGPRDFEIRSNTIDQVDADSPRAVNIGGYEDLNGDGQNVVSGNNIEDGVVSRVFYTQPGFDADDADILDATENWWGDEDGPNNAETTGAVGEVATQPFLTAPTEELENTDDGTPRRFGTELRLQGGVNTIAFPAPSERTLDESLNTTNVEHVLKYDNTAPDGDNPWDGTSGETPGALNVYVVIVEEGETASLVMEFNNSFDEKNVQLGSTGVSGGWNLVSPTEAADSSSSAFATRNANIQLASENPFQDPQRQPFEADTYEYSPYRGYWVFIDEEDGDSRVASANYDGLTLQEYLENVNLDEGS